MANETITNLRQAKAQVSVTGILAEKKLDFYKTNAQGEEVTANVSEETADGITGYISIKTGETNDVRFSIKVGKKTKEGEDSKAYPGILTVKKEYKSIATDGIDGADRVSVSPGKGNNISLYQNQQSGESVVSYSTQFINRVKNVTDEFEPKAEFTVEVFISNMRPEMVKDGDVMTESGRLLVTGWVPGYKGRIGEITLIAEEDLAEAVTEAYEKNQTVEFYGDVQSSHVTTTKTIPVKIGKPKTVIETINKNELIITGASEPYEQDVTPIVPYDPTVIAAAVQERKNQFEANKTKATNPKPAGATRPSGAKSGKVLGF